MGLIALIVVAGAAGRLLVPRDGASASELFLYRLYVGLCVSAVLIVGIGSVSLRATRIVMLTLAAGCVAWALWKRWGRPDDGGEPLAVRPLELDRFESICLAAVLVATGLTLLSALAPVTSWDATSAHLALPADYAREGRIQLIEGNVYSAYPHLLHSVYAYVFSESGETPTVLVSWLFGALACLAVYELGKRVDGRRCGLIASALFATSPIFFSQAGTVSIDVAFAGLTAGALACVFAWREDGHARMLVLAAVLAGSSCGIRHTGYLTAVLMAIGVVLLADRGRVRSAGVFCGVTIVAALPWLLRTAAVAGNPFHPFFRGVFGGAPLLDMQSASLFAHESIRETGVVGFLTFPWTIMMRPDLYDGWTASPGGLLLALGMPGLVIGGAKARQLGVFSLAGGLPFFFYERLARYLLPFFTPMMVVAAVAAVRMEKLRRPVAALLLFSFAYGVALGTAMNHFKVPTVYGVELDTKYLERRVERYLAFMWMNRNLPESMAVLTLDPRSYYIDRETYSNLEFARILVGMPLEEQLAWLEARNIRYIFYPAAYVEESTYFKMFGLLDGLNAWREDPEHFTRVYAEDLPRPRSGGTERVEIYEVRWENAGTGKA